MYSNGPHDFPEGTVADTVLRHPADLLFHVNANYDFLRKDGDSVEGVHVVRDPRDLLVSAFYSHRSSHPADGWPALQALRPVLQASSVEVGLLLELEFCSGVLEDLRSWSAAAGAAGVRTFRFEDLVLDPLAGLVAMTRHLGIEIDEPSAAQIVERYSFESLSGGRRRGSEDAEHHYRKGTPGDWRQHFAEAHRWLFTERYGDLLPLYGYSW